MTICTMSIAYWDQGSTALSENQFLLKDTFNLFLETNQYVPTDDIFEQGIKSCTFAQNRMNEEYLI